MCGVNEKQVLCVTDWLGLGQLEFVGQFCIKHCGFIGRHFHQSSWYVLLVQLFYQFLDKDIIVIVNAESRCLAYSALVSA